MGLKIPRSDKGMLMRVLIVEDNSDKAKEITSALSELIGESLSVTTVDSVASFVRERSCHDFDVEIIDLKLPFASGGHAIDATKEICQILKEQVSKSMLIAMTAFESIAKASREEFGVLGMSVVHYSHEYPAWKETLGLLLSRRTARPKFDFVIVTALETERAAFFDTEMVIRSKSIFNGFDIEFSKIGDLEGVIVCLPSMGLVSASSISTRLLVEFEIGTLCMSGICAGHKKSAKIGQVLIANPSWDHQSGKITPSGLEIAPYQVPLTERVRLLANDVLGRGKYQSKPDDFPVGLEYEEPAIVPIVSGAAVMADEDAFNRVVENQHRKIAGLDMEIYGLYRSVQLSLQRVEFFGCKTVVDQGTQSKGDNYQKYGCLASARFTVDLIKAINHS